MAREAEVKQQQGITEQDENLTINNDSCQEAFLLVGVPVMSLALLVPEARHTFRAG